MSLEAYLTVRQSEQIVIESPELWQIEHSIVSTNFVCWCHLALNLRVQSWPQVKILASASQYDLKHLWGPHHHQCTLTE
jgi:hypothetical protein